MAKGKMKRPKPHRVAMAELSKRKKPEAGTRQMAIAAIEKKVGDRTF